MSALFYDPEIKDSWLLNEEESRHAKKVLRMKVGDQLEITSGQNDLIKALIEEDKGKRLKLNPIEVNESVDSRSFKLHLVIAPTKNLDRIEWFVEKATEVGVDQVSFVLCEHSERRVLKLDRLYKKAISAMKQSKKGRLPLLSEMISFKEFISNKDSFDLTYIAHLEEGNRKSLISELTPFPNQQEICILIGPEGDFSPKEIELALNKGVTPVTLGNYRLRTETAALSACVETHVLSRIKE